MRPMPIQKYVSVWSPKAQSCRIEIGRNCISIGGLRVDSSSGLSGRGFMDDESK